MKKYDWVIVGSGLFGSTFAYFANKAGKRCLVIDKRDCLGGNLRCESIGGINVHMHGPHIFHTSDKEVWDFVNKFAEFNSFVNCPLADSHGMLYNLPFNMNTFYKLWGTYDPAEAKAKIQTQCKKEADALCGRVPANLEEQALCLVGRDIYETLIKEYTEKQWGRQCAELPPSIIKRLPVRFTFDNNYFNDTWQGVPIGGYNKLIDGLLSGIETRLSCDFINDRNEIASIAENILYTGRIDEYFGFRLGRLDFRTVMFKHDILDTPNYQGNAVVNHIDKVIPYTRTIEHKHFESFGNDVYKTNSTVVSKEYSIEWKEGLEPYYPINDDANMALYGKYAELARHERNVVFGGRLAEYKYYDMAPIISKIISMFKNGQDNLHISAQGIQL